jgi:hypothetical protein
MFFLELLTMFLLGCGGIWILRGIMSPPGYMTRTLLTRGFLALGLGLAAGYLAKLNGRDLHASPAIIGLMLAFFYARRFAHRLWRRVR